jgi:hypothetical protein
MEIYVIECMNKYDESTYLGGVFSTREQAREAYNNAPYSYAFLYAVILNQEIANPEKYLVTNPDNDWVNEENQHT